MQTTKRIEYLDALRGFTMILVVTFHIAYSTLKIDATHCGNLHYYFGLFRMPLFFFISGFLFYKSNFTWNASAIGKFLKKKIFVQIISPFIIFLCYIHYRDFTFVESIMDFAKKGYWFTIMLFNFFMLFILGTRLLNLLRIKRENITLAILLATSIVMSVYGLDRIVTLLGMGNTRIIDLFCIGQFRYFIYFMLGVYIKRYFNLFETLMDKYLLAITVAAFFLANVFIDLDSHTGYTGNILRTMLAVCGIVMTFGFFRKHGTFFSSTNRVAASMRFIGKRTLDIYLLHYFFLSEYSKVFPSFKEYNLPLLEFAVSLMLALLVIAACLLISAVLRLDNNMAHYLFGAKKK